ncbi:hypothetical protein G6F46_014325 [Rhizopus delemar]|nr:hypothetical protein G6F46_014325 [Rhizopus delemar]
MGIGRCRRGAVARTLDGLERHAAHRHGHQRLRAHLQAVRIHAEVHAAGIPEARAVGHELVVGRIHEHFDIHGAARLVQRIADHAAHIDAAKVDG